MNCGSVDALVGDGAETGRDVRSDTFACDGLRMTRLLEQYGPWGHNTIE